MTPQNVKSAGASRATATLLVGRTLGFAVAFGIPVVLARVLDQHEFGTYKYLFLIATTLNVVLQFGMAESLYYFVPRQSGSAGRPVANALTMLALIGLVVAVGLAFGHATVARLLDSASIEPYVPLLGAFLALTLVALPLETVMISRKQYRAAATTYAVSDSVKAAFFMVPGVVTRSLTAVMVGAVIFAGIRVLATTAYVCSAFRSDLRLDRPTWKAQLAYALPFSIAVFIETAQLNLHQFVVWHRFDPAIFAVYSAGCLQIPLVDLLTSSVGNVMMVQMGENAAARDKALLLWHRAVTRLAFVLWPLVVALVLTSRDLIVTLFTSAYLGSVPIFAISTVTVALAAFPVDSVLRVYAQTSFLIVMNLIRLAMVAVGIGWAIAQLDLEGAIAVTVMSLAATKALAVWRIARVLGVSLAQVLPWHALGGTAALAAVAAVPAWWVSQELAGVPVLVHGALVAGVYGLIYLALDLVLRSRGPVLPIRAWLNGRT